MDLEKPIKKICADDAWVEEPMKLRCNDCYCIISTKIHNKNIGDCESCWDIKYSKQPN